MNKRFSTLAHLDQNVSYMSSRVKSIAAIAAMKNRKTGKSENREKIESRKNPPNHETNERPKGLLGDLLSSFEKNRQNST